MSADRLAAASKGRIAWVWPVLVAALGAVAYRPLFTSATQLPTAYQFELWMFRPSQLPTVLVLGVAGWLVWRRRKRLRALPERRSRAAAAVLGLIGAAGFVWAVLTRSGDLLLPSLAANLLAFGCAARGRAGGRAVLLPAIVLVLGVQIPAPLRHEIVWDLQLASASSSAWLLGQVGREFILDGVILRNAEHSFHVIDGCSGLQGIATLTLVAIIVRELLMPCTARVWLLVAVAPLLGFALNTVRIAYVAASSHPEAYAGLQGDHTPQGLALLAAGTALLYALGWSIARSTPVEPSSRDAGGAAPWPLAAGWLASLAALSLLLTPFPPAREPAYTKPAFPEARAGWRSEPLEGDPYFVDPMAGTQTLFRRYEWSNAEPPPKPVDLFIGIDQGDGLLLSSKLAWPGPEWHLESRRPTHLWSLDRDADFAVAARGTGQDRAVVYTWRLRDEGLWRESLRTLLALESSPFRRSVPPAVVRLVAYSPFDEGLAISHAKRRMDRFVMDFSDELGAL